MGFRTAQVSCVPSLAWLRTVQSSGRMALEPPFPLWQRGVLLGLALLPLDDPPMGEGAELVSKGPLSGQVRQAPVGSWQLGRVGGQERAGSRGIPSCVTLPGLCLHHALRGPSSALASSSVEGWERPCHAVLCACI